ncbi:MAG: alpha/beta hydrolase family protein [Chloroflexota bacterium]
MTHTKLLCLTGMLLLLLAACGYNPYPLAENGPYRVGMRTIHLVDESREDRRVSVTLWYPAVQPADPTSTMPTRDAEADAKGAPYPLLLSSTKVATIFAPYLVSRGFVWASVDGIDSYFSFYEGAIEQPLDILFALEQVASNPPEGLEGLFDANMAGTIGYSFDGFNSLAMSGARIDPEYYLSQCPTPDATTEAVLGKLSALSCGPAGEWDEFSASLDEAITATQDGLWQPLTDARIRAIMPMACEGWWLFGEKGLAAVDRPVLMIDATNDELYKENVLIYERLGTSDKALISFVGRDHMMIYDAGMVARMAHFAAAFFGYHLQGRQDFARYYSEAFVSKHDDLAWGVFPGK